MICAKCGLVWSDPLPHNPRDFYEDDYRVSYKGTYSPKPKHIVRAGNVALSRYRKIEQLLSKPLTILDVGSGGGEFSYLLQTLGHDVKGIEPNKGYAEYSIREYGLNVQVGFVQDVMLQEESFDLITIWHVLEHTENPFEVLVKLHALLKPQGILVIEVPNIEATCQSPKSTFHEAHIFNFNIATLQRLAEKAGFTEMTHIVSADGGNITILVQNELKSGIDRRELNIHGNSARIAKIVSGHTPLKHYMTAHPYTRLLRRIRQSFLEKRGTTNFTGGKQLLDQLYSQSRNPCSNPAKSI
ncbi:MAG: class I SAM-dependent methyltransferase [Rhodocyclaceae bacterium]|nr:class I SAM-dependent methyltransferase [Rhodocyclaceae bacterium]